MWGGTLHHPRLSNPSTRPFLARRCGEESKYTPYTADTTNIFSQSLATPIAHASAYAPSPHVPTQYFATTMTHTSTHRLHRTLPIDVMSHIALRCKSRVDRERFSRRSLVLQPRAPSSYRIHASSDRVLSRGRSSTIFTLPHPCAWRRPVPSGASSMAHALPHPCV